MSPLRAQRSPRDTSSAGGWNRLSRARGGEGAGACAAARRPRGTAPPSRAGALPVPALGGTGLLPTPAPGPEARCGGGGGAGAARRLVAASGPRPWAPRSPGQVASWRVGCGDKAWGSAAVSPRPQWPEGLRGALARLRPPAPALPAAPARSSLLPVSLRPPASAPRSATSASRTGHPSRRPAGPPPAPSLLCCAMRVGFPI